MKKYLAKAAVLVAWARTRQGKTEIGAAIGAIGALYDALHKAGVL